MTWLSTNSVPLLFLLVIAGLGSWGAYTQQRAERLAQDNQQLTRQRDTAQFILGNQQRAMTLFNAIAEATHEEKARTPNTWRPCASSFARNWKRCRLLLCGCLPLWLTACVTPPPTFVALPPIGVSPELLADCIVPPVPEPLPSAQALITTCNCWR